LTYGADGDEPSATQPREIAREKARALREEHRKQERRGRLFLRGGIVVGIIAIALVIFFVVQGSIPKPATGPLNMASDGIVIGKGDKVAETPALSSDDKPIPTVRDKSSSVVSIRLYVDYFCPVCKSFETTNRAQLSSWLKSGAITLEIHPIALFDRSSLGSAYSTRAANAAACVANYSPNDYWSFSQRMYAKQPAQNTAGLTNAQILAVIKAAGVHNLSKITDCVNTERFKAWVVASTDRALAGPLPDSTARKVASAPTVIVDGQEYPITSADVSSAAAFTTFVEQTAGSQFDSGTSTPSPTPSPTPTPTPSK
jgi:protein-disulfide isomerase